MATAVAPPRPTTVAQKQPESCPYCGQPLLNQSAARHLLASEREFERKLERTAREKAKTLAVEQITRFKAEQEKKLERLQEQVVDQADELAKAKSEHAEQLRELRVKVRAEAETKAVREAEAKVRTELRLKDKALAGFQEQLEVQQRQIEHLTADERGELNEERLLAELRAAFPDDTIDRRGRGRAGGDILHEVVARTGDGPVNAGLIVYECKDTQTWSNSWLEQVRKEGETHRTSYLVIITRAFPSGEKTLLVKDGVVVVHPSRAIDLARIMRRMAVEVHRVGLTADGQKVKSAELCEYLASSEFRRDFDVVAGTSDKLDVLLSKERTWHEHSWVKRQSIHNEIGSKTAAIDARIRTILEKQAPARGGEVVELKQVS